MFAPVAAPQGLVCLTMMTAGLAELLRQLPAGVEIDEVVEAEFLALELGAPAMPRPEPSAVEGGALVGIFAVAQRLGQRKVDAQRRGQAARCQARPALGRGSFGDLVESVGDGRSRMRR